VDGITQTTQHNMRSFILAFLLSIVTLTAVPVFADEAKDTKELGLKAKTAVALLYSQDDSGGMHMHCTATAYEKFARDEKVADHDVKVQGYHFVTAAHCVGNDRKSKAKSADASRIPFFLTFDEVNAPKVYYPAKPILIGYQSKGDDFSAFEVQTDKEWTVIPLGDEKKAKDGEKIVNVASPLGLGKQVFEGTISSLYIDRPVISGDINWKGAMFLQISAGPGSSGSSIISVEQKAIVGFLVGTVGGNNIVAIPVSRFKTVIQQVADGKYKYFKPSDADEGGDSDDDDSIGALQQVQWNIALHWYPELRSIQQHQ